MCLSNVQLAYSIKWDKWVRERVEGPYMHKGYIVGAEGENAGLIIKSNSKYD